MTGHLRPVDELGPSEIHAGALAAHHVGLTVIVRRGSTVLAGRLMAVPTASMTKPLLVLRVGDFQVALHPTAVVSTVPDGAKANITVAPRKTPTPRRRGTIPAPASSGGVVADATNGERSMKLLPGRWRNRRKCYCGCGGKSSHGGYANGVAMTSGCEWAMRYWVTHGQLPTRATGESLT